MKEMKAGDGDRGKENGQQGKNSSEKCMEKGRKLERARTGKQKEDSERNGTEDRYVPFQLAASIYVAELHLIQEVQTVPSSERVRAYNPPS